MTEHSAKFLKHIADSVEFWAKQSDKNIVGQDKALGRLNSLVASILDVIDENYAIIHMNDEEEKDFGDNLREEWLKGHEPQSVKRNEQ